VLRINERFSIAGAAGVLGLVFVLGLFGFLSLLGANPSKPLDSLRSEEEVVAEEGSDGRLRNAPAGQSENQPGAVTPEESAAADEPQGDASPASTTPPAAVLAAVAAARDSRPTPTPAPGQPQATPVKVATATPTPQATLDPTPNPTPAPTAPPVTPAPEPGACSATGAPSIRETGHHVRLEYASVITFQGDILLVDVAGTVTALRITSLTLVTGDLARATLVRAEGHRESDRSVTAELVTVLCPDSARG
jgi:hypothetical protein